MMGENKKETTPAGTEVELKASVNLENIKEFQELFERARNLLDQLHETLQQIRTFEIGIERAKKSRNAFLIAADSVKSISFEIPGDKSVERV
jgi:hypothetical protein